jgi:flagellar motor switch protein FliG
VSGISLHTAGATGAPQGAAAEVLTRRQKAAVIVRLLLSQGDQIPLAALPEAHQAELTEAMARMRAVSRGTLRAVVEEFLSELESVGLSFPGGIDAALAALDGHLSATTVSRLRRKAMDDGAGDPWAQIAGLAPEALLGALERESIEIGAVLLSKLSVGKAADLLGRLPGERARRLAHAIAETGRISPANVRRIGLALLDSLETLPETAFDSTPVERVGAILNHSPATTRDEVLGGLEQEDAAFAAEVRKAIFTFADIPARVAPADVPRIARECEAATFVTALAAALGGDEAPRAAAEFLLGGLSQRMAGQIRDEIADRGAVKARDGEAAMGQVVAAIRALEGRGEIMLLAKEP